MSQSVQVQGVGTVDFPDDASPAEIQAALNQQFPEEKTSAVGAAGRGFLTNLLPTGAAVGTAVAGEAAFAPESAGASLLMIPPTLAAGWLAGKLQQKAIHKFAPKLEELQQSDVRQHPWASTAGSVAAALPFAEVSPGTVLNLKKAAVPAAIGATTGVVMPLVEGHKPTAQDVVGGIAGATLFGQARFGPRLARLAAARKNIPSNVEQAAKTISQDAPILPKAAAEAARSLAQDDLAGVKTPPAVETSQEAPPAAQPAPVKEEVPPPIPTVSETTPPVPPEEMPSGPTETGLRPAIRLVGGKVAVGEAGETHPDIIKRDSLKAEDIDQRGFVDQAGVFKDREQAAAQTGLPTNREPARQHSTDLPEAKSKAEPKVKASAIKSKLPNLTDQQAVEIERMSPSEANSKIHAAIAARDALNNAGRTVSDPERLNAEDYASGVFWKAQQAGLPEASVSPESYRLIKPEEASDPAKLNDILKAGAAGRKSGALESETTRLVAMTDAQGKVHLVSAYKPGRSDTFRIYDPATGKHRSLDAILEQYTPQATVLRNEPVKNFHQEFPSMEAFQKEVGAPAQAAKSAEGKYTPPAEIAFEDGRPTPVQHTETPVEPGEMVEHMAKFLSLDAAKEALATSPDKARLQEALIAAMHQLQDREPNLTPEQSLDRALNDFYAQSQSLKTRRGPQPPRANVPAAVQAQAPGVRPVQAGGAGRVPEAAPSSLSQAEASRLKALTEKLESGQKLSKAEQSKFRELREKASGPQPQEKPGISVGPGAASPGDVPQQSELTQLSSWMRNQSISPREPLGQRIRDKMDAAGRWGRTKDRVTDALGKMVAFKDAAIDWYLHLPPWTDFTAAIGRWSLADQESAKAVANFQHQVDRSVPNKLRQEAITNWIQADGDESVLRQRAELTNDPKLRRGYEIALQLNDAEKALANNIRSYLDSRLQEGIDAGLLKQGIDLYMPQVWKRANNSVMQRLWAELFGTGTLNPNFKFARRRIFDTYFKGEQLGFVPKDKTIRYLLSAYDISFNRALSARALIKELQSGKARDGMPITMTSGKTQPIELPSGEAKAYLIKPNLAPKGAVTEDGRPYLPLDHWALRDWKWATTGPDGKPVFVQGDMLVHPDHFKHLRNVLNYSRLRSNAFTRTLLQAQSLAKQTKLSLSGFHLTQEMTHALAHRVNPLNLPPIDFAKPITRDLVAHGMMLYDPRAYELFAEGAAGGGLVGKIPGIGFLQTQFNDLLFKDIIPRLKNKMAEEAFARNMQRYAKDVKGGKITTDQVLALTAREANAAFGELDYRMLGRSQTLQDFLRLSLLAPDFLEARGRFVGQAFKPYGREQLFALCIMAGALFTAARILNKTVDGEYHWDKPFSLVTGGREYSLRTVLGDAWHLWSDPRSFWHSRMAPISKSLVEYVTGRDDRGIKRTSLEQLADFATWFKPIPAQRQPGETPTQSVLGALGLQSKRANRQDELFKLLDDWRSAQTNPKIREQYDIWRKETHAESPYKSLRLALENDDLKAAKEEFDRLRKGGHSVHSIFQAMNPARPFTGSRVTEAMFLRGLTPQQQMIYREALAERRQNYQRFLKAIR